VNGCGNVADWIEETLIRFSQSAPRGRLPSERELAEMFGVSRWAIREAFRRLIGRGLVDGRVGIGMIIRPASRAALAHPLGKLLRRRGTTARQMIEARSMLGSEPAQLACLRATDEDIEALGYARQLDHRGHRSAPASTYRPAIPPIRGACSTRPGDRDDVLAILTPVAEMMGPSISDEHVSGEALPFHGRICAAIVGRNVAAAARATGGHLGVGERLYGADLDVELDALVRRRLATVRSQDLAAELVNSRHLIDAIVEEVGA
jgi:DNA-binding FadR family transcriptional regulator